MATLLYKKRPWSDDHTNPFSAPWVAGSAPCDTVSSSGGKTAQLYLKNYVPVVFFRTNPMDAVQAKRFLRHYEFAANAVSACCSVRPRWDYESAQQIIPLFMAAVEIGAVIGTLKEKDLKLIRQWWTKRSLEEKNAFQDLEEFLTNSWPAYQQDDFLARQKNHRRERYYKYTPYNVADAFIAAPDGNLFMFFSKIPLNLADIQVDKLKVMNEITKRQMKRDSGAQFAYWHVILETMNIFMHISSDAELPRAFPKLVADLKQSRRALGELAELARNNYMGSAIRLSAVADAIQKAVKCFTANEDRNQEMLKLSPKERAEIYKKRRKAYRKEPERSAAPNQADLFEMVL